MTEPKAATGDKHEIEDDALEGVVGGGGLAPPSKGAEDWTSHAAADNGPVAHPAGEHGAASSAATAAQQDAAASGDRQGAAAVAGEVQARIEQMMHDVGAKIAAMQEAETRTPTHIIKP